MAKRPTVNLIGSGYASKDLLNNNFEELRDAFDNTLSLDGSTPNAMGADFDMNSNDILNVGTLRADNLDVNGTDFDALATQVAADAAAAAASLEEFEELYLGAKATDPTVDNEGNPLQTGALYVNTGSNSLLYYDGTGWVAPAQAATKIVTATGDGTTTDYALGTTTANPQSIFVYVDGVYQNKDGYSVSGSTLTFSVAPSLNADIEFVVFTAVIVGGTLSDLVTYNQGDTGAVDTTVQAKLQEVVSIKDFGAVCDGATDDTTAVQTAITAVGSNMVTLVVPGPTKINGALTFNGNTQVKFYNGGKFVGTAGTEVVTLQRQPSADVQQIFDNVDPYFTTAVTLLPEWFGAVKDGSTDDRTAFTDAMRSIRNVGGIIQLGAGNYAISDYLSIDYNNITIQGAGNNSTYLLVTGINKGGIVINGTAGARLRNIMLRDFSIRLVTDATAPCTGIYSYYNQYPIFERMQIQDFLIGVKMEGSTNSQFSKVGATYTGATNGFIGFDIYGGATSAATGGNQSSILRDCYASGMAGLTSQFGFKFTGGYMSDFQFDLCETALTTYGFYIDYAQAPDFNVDVIIRDPVVDRFFAQGIFISGLASNGVMQIIGGYTNPEADNTQNMYFNSSQGAVTVIGHQFMALQNPTTTTGFYGTNSNNISVGNCTFTKLSKGVALNSCGYSVISNNVFLGGNPSAFAKSVEIIGGARVMVNGNSFAGAAEGVNIDATSSGCGIVGNTSNLNTVGTSFTNSGSGPIGGANGGTGLNSGI